MVDDTTNDVQLTTGDVQQLADAAQVAHFFARLHYDVDGSIGLSHATLGLDSSDLRQQILRIQRIAADPVGGNLVIYLFEVRSLTVALTQAIARRFRDRPEDALLVLTKDYTTLDFVLLERELATGRSKLGGGLRQIIRPRSLTVHRRSPDPVALRVLKRFTFTESDADYQWEKLRSAFTLAEWSEPYFNNRALFSDYYLTERLTDPRLTPAWAEDVRPVGREVLRHLSQARRTFSGQPEQVVREKLYEPLFQSLGFQAVANKTGDSALDEADYTLYAPGQPDQAIALAMTYVWNRSLDDADPTRDAQTPNEIPGALVVNVLARAAAPWVIVTNGKIWRLYSATADNKVSNTYEIDLEEAVAAPDQETALKYWWLFFRRQAFTGFLDDLVQQSTEYARDLGERLKERTFTTIFPRFAAGFIRAAQTPGVSQAAGGVLDETYRATLTFLYRLMFILYAESLSLLPVNEARGYGALSLARLKRELAEVAGKVEDEAPARLQKHYRDDSTALYTQLQQLFQAIDAGDAGLNLPLYNGGLFSPATPEGRYLANHAIPDRDLAQGLDRLCRDVDDKTQALAMIDFKSLGVRQLGSIYEGLLEFKLRVATEKLVVVKDKGKELYLPARDAGSKKPLATLNPGDVYLENDKRERKATGSYYTPDYIVKYIVEHTVGPVLERKFETLRPRLHEAQKVYRQRRQIALGKQEDPEKFWNNPDMQQLADDCLDVKVLDPAMGSGHFLVEAVDFISDRLIEFLNAWSENPVWALLDRTRQDILADMERQGVSIDGERLTRVSLLRRSVLKRCVYGVDLNAMAVELAKVSLWLDAFTLGAPLSFLDHHLKHGNSLIGARVQDVRDALAPKAGETFSLLAGNQWAGVMLATDLMRQVSFLSDNTATQLQASQAAYRDAGDHLAPYKRILDVYTSRWFGNGPSKKGFEPALELLRRPEAEAWLKDPAHARFPARDYMNAQAVADTALRAAADKRFFHWELEFPEVFFAPSTPGGQDVQLRADGGFDAVVGNPPYERTKELQEDKSYQKERYQTAVGAYDVYVLFVERALSLAHRHGGVGQIVSNKWLVADYGEQLRQIVHGSTSIDYLVDLSECPSVFQDAQVSALVMVLNNHFRLHNQTLVARFLVDIPVQISSLSTTTYRANQDDQRFVVDVRAQALLMDDVTGHLNIYLIGRTRKLIESIYGASHELRDVADVRTGTMGFNYWLMEPLTRDSNVPDDNNLPLLSPGLVDRFEVLWGHDSVQLFRGSYQSPVLRLDPAIIDDNSWALFRSPKIVVRGVAKRLSCCYDELGCALLVAIHGVRASSRENELFICALINSRLYNWIHVVKYYSARIPQGSLRYPVSFVERLPIPLICCQQVGGGIRVLPKGEKEPKELYESEQYDLLLKLVVRHLVSNDGGFIHDLLAFLAERMIELNKQKQTEVKRFLGWLEKRLAIRPKDGAGGIDSLAGRTILQGYLGDYQKGEPETAWADFYYRLHQNRGRFGAGLEVLQGEIEAEYERSLDVLRPIKRQLARTDALIDQIVYQLYGLTDEEIAIVERPAYEQALGEAKRDVLKDKTLAADPEAAVEAMAGKVLPAAQRLQTQVTLQAERAHLDQDLPGWHLFPAEVVTFLLTGEYNIASLPDFLDFSTSVVSYTKAVETMLFHRLFVRFRAESGASESDCRNQHLQRFVVEGKPLTLGSMGIILASSHEAALRRFVQQVYPRAAQTFFGSGGVATRLNDPLAVDLRNRAAHDTPLTRSDARTARDWALGILQHL